MKNLNNGSISSPTPSSDAGLLLIAIDGGGSSTEGLLVSIDGQVLAHSCGGASNPNDMGEKAAAECLAAVASELMLSAPHGCRLAVYAGVSGAIGHEEALRNALASALNCADIAAVDVGSDVTSMLAMLPGGADSDGAVLICGTGFACFVRADGTVHRVGGWGYLLDSCGGGYAVGRDAIEAALRAEDGRRGEECTAIYTAACKYVGCDRLSEGIGRIYSGGKSYIAGFSRIVFTLASSGDAAALSIIRHQAEGVAECLGVAVRLTAEKHAGACANLACLVGGGLMYEEIWRRELAVATESLPVTFLPSPPQTVGAAQLAAALVGAQLTPAATERLIGSINDKM